MRQQWSLAGTWSFATDARDQGETNRWQERGLPEAKDVQVPHIWQRDGGSLVNYHGAAWYSRSFEVGEHAPNKRLFLCFDAVDYEAQVWVNGRYIGGHEGGFTPFSFDITEALAASGEQTVAVRVYDPADNADIPIGKQGSWYTRVSGIWQDVRLEERAVRYIDRVRIVPDIGTGSIRVEYRLAGAAAPGGLLSYAVRHHLADGAAVASGSVAADGTDGELEIGIPHPILWDSDNPHLYELELILSDGGAALDARTDIFGLREVKHADGMILLNGKPLYMRGALDQAFYPDTIYTAPSDEYIQREIELAKQMGFNLLRKHIKIEIPRYLYWADRMGMLIWAEPPNYVKWTETGRRRFRDELLAMVDRDFNRPSIIIWSIYNEEWGLEWDMAGDPEKQRHVAELYDELKAYDPTRLICDNSGWTHVKTDINDHHRYFVCPDQLEAWKRDLDEFVIGDPDANFVGGYRSNGEPIIVSEFGVWGLPSLRRLREHYRDAEPWWFVNQGEETHQDDYKKPVTAEANFAKFGLNRVFASYEELAVATQRRMFRAIKSVIEEMRKRPAVAGYVVTEFTDIEWETNGWVDFLRGPKEGFERLKDFNGTLAVMADGVEHNLWVGQEAAWDVVIANDDGRAFAGIVRWSLDGTALGGEIPVALNGERHVRLDGAIRFAAPDVDRAGFHTLRLELVGGGAAEAHNEEELTIAPRAAAAGAGDVVAYAMPDDFAAKLREHGFRVGTELAAGAVVLTETLDARVLEFARQGGRVVFLAERGERLAERGQFTFRHLPEGESWPRASSFNIVDPSWFPEVPLRPEAGWEAEAIVPDYVMPFNDYKIVGGRRAIPLFGNPGLAESSEIGSWYFQGWIGQVAGSILKKPHGQGSILAVTWKLGRHYGAHPIATQLLNALVRKQEA